MADWQLVIDSFPQIFMAGLTMTVPLTIISFTLAMIIAILVALVQYAKVPVVKSICRFYIWIIRGTPLLVQLFVVFYGFPSIGVHTDPFWSAVVVFAVNEGAYCAETIRGSLESIPEGQMEAGYCVGMNYTQIMWHVVLPQALKNAFPALSNSLISMLKDTSLASNITVMEMFFQTQRIAGRNYRFMAMYLTVAGVYLIFSTILTWLQRWGEKKLNFYSAERK
jgi:cystine transport system permease protein